jgi:hypothetical protein
MRSSQNIVEDSGGAARPITCGAQLLNYFSDPAIVGRRRNCCRGANGSSSRLFSSLHFCFIKRRRHDSSSRMRSALPLREKQETGG